MFELCYRRLHHFRHDHRDKSLRSARPLLQDVVDERLERIRLTTDHPRRPNLVRWRSQIPPEPFSTADSMDELEADGFRQWNEQALRKVTRMPCRLLIV